jgi:hypothetical protein
LGILEIPSAVDSEVEGGKPDENVYDRNDGRETPKDNLDDVHLEEPHQPPIQPPDDEECERYFSQFIGMLHGKWVRKHPSLWRKWGRKSKK